MSSRAERSYSDIRELNAVPVCEDLVEQAGQRLPRRRVTEGEVLEGRNVVAAREELADGGSLVAAGTADLLGVRLEPFRQVQVVDVPDVGLVDPHAERDRRDDDAVPGGRPPLLCRDAILRLIPAWYGRAPRPAAARSEATRSAVRCSVT
jgi:hypothetical protein